MSLIVNSKQLPLNPPKDHELFEYAEEYKGKITELKTNYPSGSLTLKRVGYPKMNRNADGSMNMPELPRPIFIKYTRTDNTGAVWGYCKSRPLIHANGLVEVQPNDNSEMVSDEIWHLDFKNKPDYVFFIVYKSGLVGSEYEVYNPEGDKLKELLEKNAKLKVQGYIRDMSIEKLRLMAQAWGIKNAGTKNEYFLQEELENLVFKMEEDKKREPTNLMLKGVDAFLAEYKNDEYTRPRAILQYGIDEKRITFQPSDSCYYFDSEKLCFVGFGKEDRQDVLFKYLMKGENSEKWLMVLKGLIDADYVNGLDKYGRNWLCAQVGLPINKKPEVILESLLGVFAPQ